MRKGQDFRLAITEPVFHESLRQLLFDHSACAVGRVRWRTLPHYREALVNQVRIIEQLPRGMELPPLEDLLVMQVVDGELDAARVIESIQPRGSQTVVVLLLDARNRERWLGAVATEGVLAAVAGFRIVGGDMLQIPTADDDFVNAEAESRYSRLQPAVGDAVYRKLRRATVTIVGASRNGTLAAWSFASLGVRSIRLCDFDQLEKHNYDIMIGLDAETIHTLKVFALAEALLRYRPDLSVTCCEYSVLDERASAFIDQPTDLLVTCTDNLSSRAAVSLRGQHMLVPHLDIGTSVPTRSVRDRGGTGESNYD